MRRDAITAAALGLALATPASAITATEAADVFGSACLHADGATTIAAARDISASLGLPALKTSGPGRWKDKDRDISIGLYQDDDALECSFALLQGDVTADYATVAAAVTTVVTDAAEASMPQGEGFNRWSWEASGKPFSAVFYQRDGRFIFISKVPD
ncbi:MAG: hypothetical protein AAF618_05170 [Pseudomonadota bacterium]